jgi:hypothetical protein
MKNIHIQDLKCLHFGSHSRVEDNISFQKLVLHLLLLASNLFLLEHGPMYPTMDCNLWKVRTHSILPLEPSETPLSQLFWRMKEFSKHYTIKVFLQRCLIVRND